MGNKTPLHERHLAAGAKLVDFFGWEMPLHYGSQVEEHHQVRNAVGMFDVSHMTIIDLYGLRVRQFLRRLLANDVGRLRLPGKALYSCMLNPEGGVLDDLIVYFLSEEWFRLVVNSATRTKDLAWIRSQATQDEVEVRERADLAIIAIQGPLAWERTWRALSEAPHELVPFQGCNLDDTKRSEWFIARTGYTGEDGLEVMLPATQASDFWDELRGYNVIPCGLGARDTLRLEAGMNLYGNDMDETVTPLESGLAWTVAFAPADRDFIGRATLETQRKVGIPGKLIGLVLQARGIIRHGQAVNLLGNGEGIVTSGGFSPTLGKSIAFARVPVTTATECQVEIRGQWLPARVVKLPFVRFGKPLFT